MSEQEYDITGRPYSPPRQFDLGDAVVDAVPFWIACGVAILAAWIAGTLLARWFPRDPRRPRAPSPAAPLDKPGPHAAKLALGCVLLFLLALARAVAR